MASPRCTGACEHRPIASREEILAFADELLEASSFSDYGPNGLQVPGAAEITRVVSGVSANLALIEGAAGDGAELLIAHHGLFWEKAPLALSGRMAERLRVALSARLNVAAYHLPLDAHPGIGNNALLCDGLGLEPAGSFAAAGGRPIGTIGESAGGITIDRLLAGVGELTEREPLLLGAGPERVGRLGIVSGGGARFLDEAIALGLDGLLVGETVEQATADAREAGVHLIVAGHHATERLGIDALGELIAARFGVVHRFIDVPNPV